MHRRRFLAVAASAGAVGALAGCTQDQGANNSSDPAGADETPSTDESTPPGTASDQVTTADGTTGTATPGTPPSDPMARTGTIDGVDYTVSVTDAGCGTGPSDNTVDDIEFAEDERTLVVTGTVDAANPCRVVDVSVIDHDEDGGSVTVTITTADPEDGPDVCQQCLGAIGYEARFEFADAFPSNASVVHDGRSGRRPMASAGYASSSASAPTSPTPTTTAGE
jgi:hypothetical protein